MAPAATTGRRTSSRGSASVGNKTSPSVKATKSKTTTSKPVPPAKKASTAGGRRKRTKQEESDEDELESEGDEGQDDEGEVESDGNYKDDNNTADEEEVEEDDSEDDDFQSSRDVRTRGSGLKRTAPFKKQASTVTATKPSPTSSNPAKKVKTSTTTSSPSRKPTKKQQQPKPEPTKTFLVSPLKIPRPKGGSQAADAIQPATLEFLRDLKLNNDREYMMLNQERCDMAKEDFLDFIRMVKEGLLEADPDVMDQEPKQSMMRIHRDIRFSNDKTPYKNNFSCYFSKGGKKSIAAGYYFSVGTNGESFAGCGAWDMGSAALNRVRNGIVNHADRFQAILSTDDMKRITGGKTGIDALRPGHAPLKTGPKGFDKDHPMIEFLKKKSFAIGRSFTDEQAVSEGFLEEVLSTFDACVDFIHILNDWIG